MAEKSGKTKGVSLVKRAKIDKAQSIMFGFVSVASVVIGVTVVATVYFCQLIAYNGGVLKYEKEAVASYKLVQENLKKVSDGVKELGSNKDLESVARVSKNRQDCFSPKVQESMNNGDIEALRNCSALRVIPDMIPTSEKNITAALGSMTQLLMWSSNGEGVAFEGISETEASEIFSDTFHAIGIGVSMKDESSKVKSALDAIESSIRNYDLQSASIRFANYEDENSGRSGTNIEFSGTYATFYSDKVNITTHREVFCADAKSKKCPGDTLREKENTTDAKKEETKEGNTK